MLSPSPRPWGGEKPPPKGGVLLSSNLIHILLHMIWPFQSTLRREVRELRELVRELEAQQTRRELEWAEVAAKIQRHLERAGGILGSVRAKEERSAGGLDPIDQHLLALKFSRHNGA
jgi:alkylhydroperoxidase family enzyme